MAEQFLTSWTSTIFRERCTAQIEAVRSEANPQVHTDDLVEKFLAQKSSIQLEQFVFEQSKSKEDYLSLVSEVLTMLRQHHTRSPIKTQRLDSPSVLEEDVFTDESGNVKTH
jgi:hypothetical protein